MNMSRTKRIGGFTLAFLLTGVAFPAMGKATRPLSAAASQLESAAAACASPSVSADGRYVVFVSAAGNLHPLADNGKQNVFVRDRRNAVTLLVSIDPSRTDAGNGDSYSASISTNGRFVAFESRAGNLAPDDSNQAADIFVRDMVEHTTTLISRSVEDGHSGNGPSVTPSITPDGRYVLFESRAEDLAQEDGNGASDVFLYDRLNMSCRAITLNTDGVTASPQPLRIVPDRAKPVMSRDGRIVVFQSMCANLVSNYTPVKIPDIYIRDVTAGVTRLISSPQDESAEDWTNAYWHLDTPISADGVKILFAAQPGGGRGIGFWTIYNRATGEKTPLVPNTNGERVGAKTFIPPAISDNGRWAVFACSADDLVNNDTHQGVDIFMRDLVEGEIYLISDTEYWEGHDNSDIMPPRISGNDRYVAYQSRRSGLLVYDRQSGETVVVADSAPVQMPVFSPGGGWLAFVASPSNMPGDDPNPELNVYIRNLDTGENELVSMADQRILGVTASGGDGLTTTRFALAEDIVAFESQAYNLVEEQTGGEMNLYTAQLSGGGVSLVGRNQDGTPAVKSDFQNWCLSEDGRLLAFESDGSNMVAHDTNGMTDVFVRDLVTGTNCLISRGLNGAADGPSSHPVVSPNGRWVAFESAATNLVTNSLYCSNNIYVIDIQNETTYLASDMQPAYLHDAGKPYKPLAVNDEGDVAFTTVNSRDSERLFFYDMALTNLTWVKSDNFDLRFNYVEEINSTPQLTKIAFFTWENICIFSGIQTNGELELLKVGERGDYEPLLSDNGEWIVYLGDRSSVGSRADQLIIENLETSEDEFVSWNHDNTELGDRDSYAPSVSADGRYVAFQSLASNLVPNDTNGVFDVFLRDVVADTTSLLSVNRSGAGSGDYPSFNPIISPDGRIVVFESEATDLVEGDFNQSKDIFVARINAGDSDNDGLPDDWELTYFGGIDQNGEGDFDQDGIPNGAEYRAGTNPTLEASLLEVITITRLGGESTTVIWNAVEGKTYRVQYKDSLTESEWQWLSDEVVATSSRAAVVDDSVSDSTRRFYRVVLIEED